MSDITVCIMSYHYGHLVAQAIESVLGQTKRPWQIIVVDDGVGDCNFVKQRYPKVKLLRRKKNLGIVDNFNRTLAEVRTKRVMFLGADNWLHPRTIELLSEFTQDIITYDCYLVGSEIKMGEAREYMQAGYIVWKLHGTPHGSALYNVKKARKVGGYEKGKRRKSEEDTGLFTKMIAAGSIVAYVPKPLLYYRQHKGNFQ